MKRSVLFSILLFAAGCSGSGATVSDSSSADLSERPSVEPTKPADPVAPQDAATITFECKTSKPLSDGAVHVIRFALRGETLEPSIAIEIEPESPALAPLTKASLERTGGKLTLSAEPRTELTLFDNSDLTRGYVKADGGEYSDVYCTKSR